MTGRIRVAIAPAGRFHVLDLARELKALGHASYSYARNRVLYVSAFSPCHRSLVPFALPALAVEPFARGPAVVS